MRLLVEKITSLEELNLDQTGMTGAALKLMAPGLKQGAMLKRARLGGNGQFFKEKDGMEGLLLLVEKSPSLEELNLGDTGMTGAALKLMAEGLKQGVTLKIVDLRSNSALFKQQEGQDALSLLVEKGVSY